MKKVILIEDSEIHYKTIRRICEHLHVRFFPQSENNFAMFRSYFQTILTPPGEDRESFRNERIEIARATLAEFIADTEDSDVLCICDYQLFEKKPQVNGVNFYNEFLGPGKPVIFASATDDPREKGNILQCCSEGKNRMFIPKDNDLTKNITEQIKLFLEHSPVESS